MKKELDKYRVRCERLEREKDDLSGKKNRTSGMNGGTGSEVMRFQQRIRELETNNEDLIDGIKVHLMQHINVCKNSLLQTIFR